MNANQPYAEQPSTIARLSVDQQTPNRSLLTFTQYCNSSFAVKRNEPQTTTTIISLLHAATIYFQRNRLLANYAGFF